MLKHEQIIAKLTDAQKIRILTGVGSLTGRDFKILGMNGVMARNMKDYGREEFPHSTALIHSWNKELWREVAARKTDMMLADGVGLAISPGAKIKLSPYRREISEDPLLASEFAGAHAAAAKDAGLMSVLSGCYLTETDVEWMDKEPSDRVVGELLTAPYLRALSIGRADAVATDLKPIGDTYIGASTDIYSAMPENKCLVCERATDENTVKLISAGVICLSGSSNALESALVRYKKLIAAAERGEGVSPEQIAEEERDGTVISPETIDRALDSTMTFIDRCYIHKKELYSADAVSACAKNATAESAVLLKNTGNILPLTRGRSIALIGGIFPEREDGRSALDDVATELSSRGYRCVGTARGYDTGDIHKFALVEEALRVAESASTVILFLGFGYDNEKRITKTETLNLPANQLRLADALIRQGKSVVGIIASGHAPDVDFTREFKALMLAPLYVRHAAPAIASLLSGQRSPSGKLAYTLYAGSDIAFRKREMYAKRYGIKAGPFIGYRYYETAGLTLGYPFGYGLSYSRFEYSGLTVSSDAVCFTVENVGEFSATETAQLYAGRVGSSVIRPRKELCGFVRVTLRPGERRRVSIPLEIPTVLHRGRYVIEAGEYILYVGGSSRDERLKQRLRVNGADIPRDGERLIDYIQSITNVTEDNFTLEANYSLMKKPIKNILFGIGAMVIATCLAIFNVATELNSLFLGIVAGVAAVFAMSFFVVDVMERNRIYKQERKKVSEANQQHFSGAEEMPVFSTDIMFREEFDSTREEKAASEEQTDDSYDDVIRQYIDSGFRIKDAVSDFAKFAESKGVKLDAGVAESVITSLATSKLMVVDGLDSEQFNSFVMLLAEYFGVGAYVDRISGAENEDMFFSYDSYGNHAKRPILLALDSAANAKEKLFIAAMDGIDASSLKEYVKPFLYYINSPRENNEITIYNEKGANVGYTIPRNLRLIVRLADLVGADSLPDATLKFAAYNHVSYVKCQSAEEMFVYHGCNRYQLEWMLGKDGATDRISEESYKKIDKLERYVASHADYCIGNKLWLNFERQTSLLIAAELDVNEAIDLAVALRLLPSMTAALRDKLTDDDETLKGTLEFVFGEDNITACNRYLTSLGEVNQKINEIEQTRLAEQVAREKAEAEARAAEEKAAAESLERERLAEQERRRAAEEAERMREAAVLEYQNQLAEAEAKARAVAEARIKAEAEARARIETEARIKAEAEARARLEAEARQKAAAELEVRARIEAEERYRAQVARAAEERARAAAELEIRAKLDAEERARAAEAAKAEEARRAAEEKARQDAEAAAKAAAAKDERAKAMAAAEARIKALMADLKKTDKK